MKCVDCQDVLAEYALETLELSEAEQVAEHLGDGCVECRQYLEDVRASWATLADTLQPVAPPPHVKNNLVARLRTESKPTIVKLAHPFTPEPEPATPWRDGACLESSWRWQSMLPYVAATLCGIAIGFWFERNAAIDYELTARYHAQLLQAERTFGTPQMRFAALHASEDRPEIGGHLIWDSVAEELHVFAFDLGAPVDGSVYRLSFVLDDGTWVSVGNLNVGPGGVCSAVIDLPSLAGPVSRVVVTTEPLDKANADGGTHGPVGLTGEFHKQ
jgi:hypothetical protein